MASRVVNTGLNKIIDEFVGGNITVEEIGVGSDGTTASVSDTSLGTELARYASDNERRATASGRFNATIPETDDNVDDETLRELAGFVDVAGADDMVFRIDFAETPKTAGSKIEIEVQADIENI